MARIRDSRWGRWIGGLSSAGFVAGSYVAVGLLALLFTEAASEAAGLILIAIVCSYCWLRATRRSDVFLAWLAPGPISTFTGHILGIHKAWIGLPIAVLVVAFLVAEDRQEAAEA